MKGILFLSALALAVLSTDLCVQNWQCPSLSCEAGFCVQEFMSATLQADGKLYDQCEDSSECNSACCQNGLCVPNYVCELGPGQALQFEQTKVQQIVQEAKDEVDFRSIELFGVCKYNFQCRSNCCKGRTCRLFSSACNDQGVIGDTCKFNQQCQSSCCEAGKCSPIWECSNAKRTPDYEPCKYNGQCQSGCCMFGTCRKDMYWCDKQKGLNEECYFNSDCLSTCCENRKCSHVSYCYQPEDFLRDDNPRLAVFYSFLYNQDEEDLNEEEEIEALEAQIELSQIPAASSSSVGLIITIFVASFAVLCVLIVIALRYNAMEKWMKFRVGGPEQHYASLIE